MASPPNKSSNPNVFSDPYKHLINNQAPQGSNYPPVYPSSSGAGANQQSNTAAQQSQAAAGATPMVWGFGAKEAVAPVTAANRIWALCTCVLNHNQPICVCCMKPMREQADSAIHFGMSDAPELDHWHLACLLDQLMKPPKILSEPVSPASTVTVVSATVTNAMAAMGRCGVCNFTGRLHDFRHFAKQVGLP